MKYIVANLVDMLRSIERRFSRRAYWNMRDRAASTPLLLRHVVAQRGEMRSLFSLTILLFILKFRSNHLRDKCLREERKKSSCFRESKPDISRMINTRLRKKKNRIAGTWLLFFLPFILFHLVHCFRHLTNRRVCIRSSLYRCFDTVS